MAATLPPVLRPLTVPRDALRPPSADNPRLGVGMSLLAHGALLAALTLGVRWHTEEPAAVEAELWAATPQLAAPPRAAEAEPDTPPSPPAPQPPAAAPAPPPAPAAAEREAQIAVEQARKERLERERREAEDQRARALRQKAELERKQLAEKERQQQQQKAEQALRQQQAKDKAEKAEQAKREQAEAARKEKAAEAQREKLRQDQMRRMTELLGGSGNGPAGSTGTAARSAGPSATYAGRIKARIKPNIVLTDEVAGNPTAEVEVKLATDGTIVSRRIVKPSGVKAWDEAVLRAIDRTAALPRDTDGHVEPSLIISFKPQE